jgi:hypothetical protein
MENSLKNELNRMFILMGYSQSDSESSISEGDYTQKTEENEDFPFRIARMGGDKIRIENKETGDKVDIDIKLKDQFIEKLTEFKTI